MGSKDTDRNHVISIQQLTEVSVLQPCTVLPCILPWTPRIKPSEQLMLQVKGIRQDREPGGRGIWKSGSPWCSTSCMMGLLQSHRPGKSGFPNRLPFTLVVKQTGFGWVPARALMEACQNRCYHKTFQFWWISHLNHSSSKETLSTKQMLLLQKKL